MKYEEAKKKALSINHKFDTMKEYQSVYVFYDSKATGTEAEDNEVVIYKDSGKVTNYADYIMNTKESKKPIRTEYNPKGL